MQFRLLTTPVGRDTIEPQQTLAMTQRGDFRQARPRQETGLTFNFNVRNFERSFSVTIPAN